ncbi:MAG: tRNA (adenine-N1)-methyltransferase [Anaerolineaceae bacterium]|nr:tRNA (adenine-N1)-methyltransferase [Anaerolineaceae bacterium]
MAWNLYDPTASEGDLAQLVGLSHKQFIITLKAGLTFSSHRGYILHDELIGLPWGSQVLTHNGSPFFLLQPSLVDMLKYTPRSTQIMYPKDIGFILITMGIAPGQKVLETGTGSGAFTSALAYVVGEKGRVFSYETRPEVQQLAQKNLERLGLLDRVTLKHRDIASGFDEKDVDAIFLDVHNPYDYMMHVKAALKLGGFFGSILPTTSQVSKLITALQRYEFAFIEVCEILLRYYKPVPERLRPVDRMIAHTGFLIFARSVNMLEHTTTNINGE